MPRRGARCGTTLRLIYSWPHPTSLQTFMHARGKGGGGVAPDLYHSKMHRPFDFVRTLLEIVEDAVDASEVL